jgi:hypothetical protein
MNNTTPNTTTQLQALERTMGRDFIENLFEDFLNTEAFASFGFYTDLLAGAYKSVRDPQFRLLVQGNFDMFVAPQNTNV